MMDEINHTNAIEQMDEVDHMDGVELIKNGIECGWIKNINESYFMFMKFNTKQGLNWISWIPKF